MNLNKTVDSRNIRVLQFLDAYEKQEALWNPALECYKNKAARNDAYMSIIQELNVPNLTISDVKLKVKSIRTTYTKELRLLTKHNKEGKQYRPKLFWFNRANSFLKGVTVSRDKRTSITEKNLVDSNEYKQCVIGFLPEIGQQHPNESEDVIDGDVNSSRSNYDYKVMQHSEINANLPTDNIGPSEGQESTKQVQSSDQDAFVSNIITTRYNEPTRPDSATPGSNILLTAAAESSSSVCNSNYSNDECEVFCRSVAMQLRSISDSYSRSVAKLKIQQILFEAETGQYRNNSCITLPTGQHMNI